MNMNEPFTHAETYNRAIIGAIVATKLDAERGDNRRLRFREAVKFMRWRHGERYALTYAAKINAATDASEREILDWLNNGV
jgi:hypothetical protein